MIGIKNIIRGEEKVVIPFMVCVVLAALAINRSDTTLSSSSPGLRQILLIINYIATLFVIKEVLLTKRRCNGKILLLVVLSWGMNVLHVASGVSASLNFLANLQLLLVAFIKKDELSSLYKLWGIMLTIMSLLGVVAYLSFLTGSGLRYSLDQYYSNKTDVFYLNYRFAYLYMEGVVVRLCGLFHEPGIFGTSCAMYLCSEKMNLKKISNIIILIATILSFSLAAAILIILYLVLQFKHNKKAILSLAIIVGVFIVLSNFYKDNETFGYFLNRVDLENKVFDDDRTDSDFNLAYKAQKNSIVDYLLGYGAGAAKKKDFITSSYKVHIYEQGLLGSILIYFLFIYSGFKLTKRNYMALIYLLLIIVQQYNASTPVSLISFIVMYAGIAYIVEDNNSQTKLKYEKYRFDHIP